MILRVLIATRSEERVPELVALLEADDVLVQGIGGQTRIWRHLRQENFDLLFVDRALLGPNAAASIGEVRALPDLPEVVVLTETSDADERTELLAAGAWAVLEKNLDHAGTLDAVGTLLERRRERASQSFLAQEAREGSRLSDFSSLSPKMRSFLSLVRRVVNADSSLLVLGETGVGKEYLARAIHAESPRAAGPFVAINCAALSESLLESELFGHVQGAFTGATRPRRGYFELADGGTIFLDEIGEMPLQMQVKLLRVLEERAIQPVGGEQLVPVDVRLVAATNRDLAAEIEAKRFRADLYYRLSVMTLEVPPLRDRREDIPGLVESHVEHFRIRLRRPVFGVQPKTMQLLMGYSWPGNVRELINVVERAVLLAEAEELTPDDLPQAMRSDDLSAASAVAAATPDRLTTRPLKEARESLIASFERSYVQELLTDMQGRVGDAAERAGVSDRALYGIMRRHGLRKEDFRTKDASTGTRTG